MKEGARGSSRLLLVALLATLVLWNVPYGWFVLYPFKLFATWLHESAHGVVMVATGVGFDHMEIYSDASGLAFMRSGAGPTAAAFIAAAGYMGAPLLGGVFLVLGQTRRGARSVLLALAIMLGVTALFFVRNDFGLTAVSIGAGALATAALLAPEPLAIFLVNFVAAQACINAVLDIRVLFRANLVVNGVNVGGSDAHNMAAVTFGTAFSWATIWLGWSLVVFFVALRLVYVRQRAELPLLTEPAKPALAAIEPRSQ
jgi:hypothetical protein